MNPYCVCSEPGFCPRHQIEKDARRWAYCRGTSNTPDCGHKFWIAWERGNLGATAPEDPKDDEPWSCEDRIIQPAVPRPKQDLRNQAECKVGTRLKGLIFEKYRVRGSGSCPCNKHADEMDRMGCQGCRENFDTIVLWLQEGAAAKIWLRPVMAAMKMLSKVSEVKSPEETAKELLTEAIELEERRVEEYKQRVTALPRPIKGKKEVVITEVRKGTWAYGVTTTKERLDTALPETLVSLAKAGFDDPWLFIDGVENERRLKWIKAGERRLSSYRTTIHYPTIRTVGNWVLGLWELFLRNPVCERYAMFQDDFVTYPNLREYLTQCDYPAKGYFNLYTFPLNQKLCDGSVGWFASNQLGLGAVALVFDRDAVEEVLSDRLNIVRRPTIEGRRSWRNIDGGVVDAMNRIGRKEYVHNPSLVQHIGDRSTIGSNVQPKAPSFRGEDFDARDMLL